MGDQAKALIHHPTTPIKDDLLDRFPEIDDNELNILKEIIHEEKTELEETKDPKLIAYAIWSARVEIECIRRHRKEKSIINKVGNVCKLLVGKD